MQTSELRKLVADLQKLKTETQTLEVKKSAGGCPKLFDTLSSFSNQDVGGVIVFGVDEAGGFSVVGVYDANDLQKQVAEQCKQMHPPVRALFTVCEIDGKKVVSAEIPGVEVTERPVYYRGVGRIKGSYVRVGDADEQMTEYEVYSYEAFRRRVHDDLQIVEQGRLSLLNKDRLEDYLKVVKTDHPKMSANLSDEDILERMGVMSEGKLTRAGLLVFSDYPQSCFPQFSITAVSLPGVSSGQVADSGERFIDNKRMTGSLSEMLDDAVEFVRRNCRVKTIIDGNGKRIDKIEYPLAAIREAILNALVHRDYSLYTEGTPICIEMFRDRIEIVNPGGLYGQISIDLLGHARLETRNVALANILEALGVTENRYSGIPTIRAQAAEAGLPPPEFSVSHGQFKFVMRNDYQSVMETGCSSLPDFCSVPRTREEVVAYVGKSPNYVFAKIVAPLVRSGQLRLTLPDHPRSPKQRYVKA